MDFWKYLMKENISADYEDAKEKIYKIHQEAENLSYIDQMFLLEEKQGEMKVEFVKGQHKEGEMGVLYDCEGKESGQIQILEIFLGENQEKGMRSETGEKGRIVFRYSMEAEDRFWRSQYLKTKKDKKIGKKC